MKICAITDTHFGARGESPVFNEFFHTFYEKVFFPYLQKHNIKQVVHLGDVVERQKYTTYEIANSWRTRFWDRLNDLGVQVDVLVGNHDAPNNKYSNTPNAIEELWGHYPNVTIFSECAVNYYGGIPIALIPWINKNNYEMTMAFIDKCRATIAMGHLELEGFLMDQGNVAKFGMDRKLFKKFEIVMSGHYHHRSTDGHIHYLGNPYEITWADFADPRGFHVFDTDTRELEFIQNPFHMFYKITYEGGDLNIYPDTDLQGKIVRVICKKKINQELWDKFLVELQAKNPHKLEIEDLTEGISSTAEVTQVEDTLDVINHYIDEMDTQLDGNRLKAIMHDLWKQANAQV